MDSNEEMIKYITRLRDGFVHVEKWLVDNADIKENDEFQTVDADEIENSLTEAINKDGWINEGGGFGRMVNETDKANLYRWLRFCFYGRSDAGRVGNAICSYGKQDSVLAIKKAIFYMNRFLNDYEERGPFVTRMILSSVNSEFF